jgi:hypothetical protein
VYYGGEDSRLTNYLEGEPMWETKLFPTEALARAWMTAKAHRYSMVLMWIHNGCAVQYKPLRQAY